MQTAKSWLDGPRGLSSVRHVAVDAVEPTRIDCAFALRRHGHERLAVVLLDGQQPPDLIQREQLRHRSGIACHYICSPDR
ncbi:hypothetical protein FCJ60_35790 [Burkholderia metallica]|nr:hypothetical protein [Burkholderia metallica]